MELEIKMTNETSLTQMVEDAEAGTVEPTEPEDLDSVKAELKEVGLEINRLESQLHGIPNLVDKLQHQVNEGRIRQGQLERRLRELMPVQPLPPLPSFEHMMSMAASQCPDRDRAVIKRLAGHLHAVASTGVNAGEKYYPSRTPAKIDGKNVRNVEDHRYNLTPPPLTKEEIERREKKSYG